MTGRHLFKVCLKCGKYGEHPMNILISCRYKAFTAAEKTKS